MALPQRTHPLTSSLFLAITATGTFLATLLCFFLFFARSRHPRRMRGARGRATHRYVIIDQPLRIENGQQVSDVMWDPIPDRTNTVFDWKDTSPPFPHAPAALWITGIRFQRLSERAIQVITSDGSGDWTTENQPILLRIHPAGRPLDPSARIEVLGAQLLLLESIRLPRGMLADRLDVFLTWPPEFRPLIWSAMEPVLLQEADRVVWLPAQAPVRRWALSAGTVNQGFIRGTVHPVLETGRWDWVRVGSGPVRSLLGITFFMVARFRATETMVLSVRAARTDAIFLAVSLSDGWVRHTLTNAGATVLLHDEVNGCRVDPDDNTSGAFVYGFQYQPRPRGGGVRLVVVPPSGIVQEIEHPGLPAEEFPVVGRLTIGPSQGAILLHEVCVFPRVALSDHQMFQAHQDLRRRWY